MKSSLQLKPFAEEEQVQSYLNKWPTGRDHAAGTASGLSHENDFWDTNNQGLSCYYNK